MSGKTLAALLAVATSIFAGQDQVSISGLIRDGKDVPVVDATLVAIASGKSAPESQAVSDEKGGYRLTGLKPGAYRIGVSAPGFASQDKEVATGAADTTVDFKLAPAATPPKLAAAGVRGLIDPGGYSVPAAAASASGLVTGMADIERQGNALKTEWPCKLEPELTRAAHSNSPDAESTLGEFYLVHRRFQEAYLHLKRASERLSDARLLKLLAEACEGSGLFAEAAQAYQESAKLDPSEESLFGYGYELILNGSADAAAAAFQSALVKRPESFKLWIGSGAAEFLANRPDGAVHAFLRAIDLRPDNPVSYGYLAKAVAGGGSSNAQADRAFEQFAASSPHDAEALFYYALSLRRQNPREARIAVLLTQSIALNAAFAEAHFELATWYAGQGNAEKAIGEYEETVKCKPNFAQAHYRLALAYRSAGNLQLSARELSIFEALKGHSKSNSDSEIDLAPLISVLTPSGEKPQTQVSCTDEKP